MALYRWLNTSNIISIVIAHSKCGNKLTFGNFYPGCGSACTKPDTKIWGMCSHTYIHMQSYVLVCIYVFREFIHIARDAGLSARRPIQRSEVCARMHTHIWNHMKSYVSVYVYTCFQMYTYSTRCWSACTKPDTKIKGMLAYAYIRMKWYVLVHMYVFINVYI